MKKVLSIGVGVGAALVAGAANAAGIDYTTLTSSVDFTTATTAVLSVFAALALILVAFKGGKLVLRAIR